MKKNSLILIAIVIAIAVGVLIGRSTGPASADGAAASSNREILYWVAPMDPNFRRDEPGKSPMGMDLVPVYADEIDGQPGVVSIVKPSMKSTMRRCSALSTGLSRSKA